MPGDDPSHVAALVTGSGAATQWEYVAVQVKGHASDAGLLGGLNDLGHLGWEVLLIRPDCTPYQSLGGMLQKWTVFAKRPKRLIAPANELEGLDLAGANG